MSLKSEADQPKSSPSGLPFNVPQKLISSLGALLRPPEFPCGELTLAVRSVHRVVCMVVLVGTFFLSCLIVLQPDTLVRRLGTIVTLITLGLLLLSINRRGLPKLASTVLIVGLTLILSIRAYTAGGISAPAMTGFVVIAEIAGLLLGLRLGLVTVAAHAALALGMVLAEHHGMLPPSGLVMTPLAQWFYLCLWLGLAVILQIQVTGTLREALSRAQTELTERRQTEQRLQVALEAGNIAVWDLDPDTRRVVGDLRLFKLLGLPPTADHLISHDTWAARIHAEDLPEVDATLRSLVNAGQVAHFRFRLVRPEGDVRHVEAVGTLLGAEGGRPPKVIGMNLDVTERHAAEKERTRLLFDLGERVKELNLLHQATRLLRRERPANEALFQELVGLMPAAWQFPDDCSARISYGDIQVMTPGWSDAAAGLSVDFEASTGKGTLEIIYRTAHPSSDEGPFLKEERALLVSLADMLVSYLEMQRRQDELESLVAIRTLELKESYERLQQLEQLRDDLVHMVVHDMRSPLTVVMARLDILKMVAAKNLTPDALRHVQFARESADAVVRMACDLLDVRRLEENQLTLAPSTVDLVALTQKAVRSLSGLDVRRSFEIEPAHAVEAYCDSGLIARVMENLIGNAIKHTPVEAMIRIEIARSVDSVRVSIRDQGKGIPPEAQAKLFRKFGTLETRSGGAYHSAGLGLVFCKMVIEAHGGTIGVDSSEGQGSTFRFDLPQK
jgi:PAS domain S-box-containing protein